MAGWVKLHRTITDSFVFQNPDRLKFWVWCLCKASHKERKQNVGLQEVDLKKGQFVFGRKKASSELLMDESKIYRLLKTFEKRNKIEVESNNKFSVVTIVNWSFYQDDEQQSEQQSNNNLTTNKQQSNTNKNVKKVENVNTKDIVQFLNDKASTNYKHTTKKTNDLINARINEGFTKDDFIKVITVKTNEWLNTEHSKYLRPETLFGNKFEGYLNQAMVNQNETYKPKYINDTIELPDWAKED